MIGVAAVDQLADHGEHCVDVVRRLGHAALLELVGDLEAELLAVVEKGLRVERGDLVRVTRIVDRGRVGLALLLCRGKLLGGDLHLVFAPAVGQIVFGHVADVRDVHHVTDLQPDQLQEATQHVGEEEAAEVADVCKVVHGRPARVHAHDGRREWRIRLFAVRERVVEPHRRQVDRLGHARP